MAVSAVSGSITSTEASRSEKSRIGLADNFSDFLVLLTTQLKNQDPTTPMDSNQFTEQLVSFAQVEQSVNANDNLEKILASNQTSQMNGSVSYLGKVVEAPGDTFTVANGKGEFFYNLDSQAAQTTITVTDMSGMTIATGVGQTSAGKHTFKWDAKDKDGNPIPDGSYKVKISALDADGNAIQTTTSVSNVVNGVSMQDGKPTLFMGDNGDISIPLEKVLSVRFGSF